MSGQRGLSSCLQLPSGSGMYQLCSKSSVGRATFPHGTIQVKHCNYLQSGLKIHTQFFFTRSQTSQMPLLHQSKRGKGREECSLSPVKVIVMITGGNTATLRITVRGRRAWWKEQILQYPFPSPDSFYSEIHWGCRR